MLKCDFGNLEHEVRQLEEAGVSAIHLDVMDGHFVPNLTYGMPIVEGLRRLTSLPLDTHLMITRPENYVQQFYDAGADMITIHCEATDRPRQVLETIRDLGAGAGIAINPGTPLSQLEPCVDVCDLVLTMSVEAGFGGQTFDPVTIDRLRSVREMAGPDVLLEVDGGLNEANVATCTEAGAQLLVVGSTIFKNQDYGPIVQRLTRIATQDN